MDTSSVNTGLSSGDVMIIMWSMERSLSGQLTCIMIVLLVDLIIMIKLRTLNGRIPNSCI